VPIEAGTVRHGRSASHPDAELLAEYADNRLRPEDRAAIEHHLALCPDCRDVLADATDVNETPIVVPRRPLVFPKRWVLGAAAGLAAAAGVFLAVSGTLSPSAVAGVEELVAAVNAAPTRPLESRLGGLRYAPPPPITRGGPVERTSPDIRIAAATVEKSAAGRSGGTSAAAKGLAHAVVGELDPAIAELERAVREEPANAQWLSDLSALYVARGRRDNRTTDQESAAARAARALEIDGSNASACFNRALALEALAQRDQARIVWQRCLDIEGDSGWAGEIRGHLTSR
jgi:hypothetical protein